MKISEAIKQLKKLWKEEEEDIELSLAVYDKDKKVCTTQIVEGLIRNTSLCYPTAEFWSRECLIEDVPDKEMQDFDESWNKDLNIEMALMPRNFKGEKRYMGSLGERISRFSGSIAQIDLAEEHGRHVVETLQELKEYILKHNHKYIQQTNPKS